MDSLEQVVKLKRGTATRIARRLKLSVNHVDKVLKGERVGRPALMRAIEREKQKQQEKQRQLASAA